MLVRDPHWGELLRYCVQKRAYRGVELPPVSSARDGEAAAEGMDPAEEELQDDLDELLIGTEPSEKVQQEGLEMPTFE